MMKIKGTLMKRYSILMVGEDSILSKNQLKIDHRPKYKTQNNKTSTRPHRRNPK